MAMIERLLRLTREEKSWNAAATGGGGGGGEEGKSDATRSKMALHPDR